MTLSKVSMDIHSCSRRCSFGKRPMLYFKNTYAVRLRARSKLSFHPVWLRTRSIVLCCSLWNPINIGLRVGHAMHWHIPSLIYYILYVLSGAQAHRDHAEDVWRASAPEEALLSTYPEGGWGWGWAGEVAWDQPFLRAAPRRNVRAFSATYCNGVSHHNAPFTATPRKNDTHQSYYGKIVSIYSIIYLLYYCIYLLYISCML